MKVLLINPDYPQTFWSFEKVIKILGKKCVQPPLGLLTVAALLPREWELELADLTAKPLTEAQWNNCDVVFITGLPSQYSAMVWAIKEAKKRGKFVVAGGPTLFHVPQDAFKAGADIIVKGEAESVASQLVEGIVQRNSGLLLEGLDRPCMSDSPTPRFDLLNLDVYVDMAVQFSRGCPFHCEFCDITLMFGRKVRTKKPDQVIKELQTLYDLGWRRLIFFADDNFIGNPQKAKELLKEIITWQEKHDYPFEFNTQASVNLAKDKELLRLMAKAGFWKIFLGIETLSKEALNDAQKFQNAAVDLDEVCQTINKAGIQIIAGCILGFDNEAAGADQQLIDFARRTNIPEMFVTLLQAAPGTSLWKRLEREERLLFAGYHDDLGSQTVLMNFETTRDKHEIAREFINLYDTLYEPKFYMERSYNHIVQMGKMPYKKGLEVPRLNEIKAGLYTILQNGILRSGQILFWKRLLTIALKYPDRFKQFMSACVVAEHYYEYRTTIRHILEAQIAAEENAESAARGALLQT